MLVAWKRRMKKGLWCLEIDPFGDLVVDMERKELKDFLEQRFILA